MCDLHIVLCNSLSVLQLSAVLKTNRCTLLK